jgi:hypothetical protein
MPIWNREGSLSVSAKARFWHAILKCLGALVAG